jgi:hypothetical protein
VTREQLCAAIMDRDQTPEFIMIAIRPDQTVSIMANIPLEAALDVMEEYVIGVNMEKSRYEYKH